jgi:hypothetical protein
MTKQWYRKTTIDWLVLHKKSEGEEQRIGERGGEREKGERGEQRQCGGERKAIKCEPLLNE